ncbi:hypothetical protein [Brachybacterium saurashtrense]|uniref:4-hydroxybenzoate polyprenyltransferase n=1 Tax=Brachybacterium saurashtrense TaxID=556288 RepID=A0A345YN06_9MICO|nr:hypothetical protein [Brachybacterium saurashtrense]AXK45308.1 hypothetical protein DWV08_06540 [Brachybacterium saurashtrense]RRR21935.1 hypothetical protein DXU92_11530 [Brachybacterium saurashtrense]
MIDQLMILAESGAEASEGLSAPAVGIGIFAILMVLLGITWLTGGAHHRSLDAKRDASGDTDH